MTVVRRRTAAERFPIGRRAPLAQRFPVGRKVAVVEDFADDRYAERKGIVVAVQTDADDRTYPHGRVGVQLVYDELMHEVFGGKAPSTTWFKPSDLERL